MKIFWPAMSARSSPTRATPFTSTISISSRSSATNSRSARWPAKSGNHQVSKVEFTAEDIKKGDYPHYMLKEIFEQPGSVRDAMRGRLSSEECTAKLGGLNMTPAQLRDVGRVVLTGCGTALHAGDGRRIS